MYIDIYLYCISGGLQLALNGRNEPKVNQRNRKEFLCLWPIIEIKKKWSFLIKYAKTQNELLSNRDRH